MFELQESKATLYAMKEGISKSLEKSPMVASAAFGSAVSNGTTNRTHMNDSTAPQQATSFGCAVLRLTRSL
jgi:hypothetical protein